MLRDIAATVRKFAHPSWINAGLIGRASALLASVVMLSLLAESDLRTCLPGRHPNGPIEPELVAVDVAVAGDLKHEAGEFLGLA